MFDKIPPMELAEMTYRREQLRQQIAVRRFHDKLRRQRRRMASDLTS